MRRILLIGCLFVAIAAAAQQKEVLKVWEGNMPNSNGRDDVPTLTVYHPEKTNGITIVMCPGGGYGHLALTHEGHDMAKWMTSMGVTYCVLQYRLPYLHKEVPQSDAEQAIRLVRQHADEWGVKPKMVGIMGGSAGGHLAATVATLYSGRDVRPDFQILLYPVISLEKSVTNAGTRNNLIGEDAPDELVKQYTLDLHVNERTPQAFITFSSDDTGVLPVNALRYYQALLNNKVSAELHAYPTGGHGWGYKDSFVYKKQWTAELENWLQRSILRK